MAAQGIIGKVPILSTAGAVPIRNEKGETTMEKVKVARYVTGKRPDWYHPSDEEDEEDFEFGAERQKSAGLPQVKTEEEKVDRRLRRLQERHREEDEEDEEEEMLPRHERRRRLHEPEVIATGSDDEDQMDIKREMEEESEEEEELDEEEIERRRALLRQHVKKQRVTEEEQEIMDVQEEEKSEASEEEESSEYEEYTDSEEEETGPRLKPVFVRKKDRVTIQEKEKEAIRQRELEAEAKKMAEERRRQTLKMVEAEVKREMEVARETMDACDLVNTDDENDEEEYELWKVRELKRIKRDREERENIEKEKLEIERFHNMTEEERRAEQRANPKVVTNKASKGKYRFLQKYYHRGAFFLDNEENVYKRDVSAPTLEDHFDKTILPKVMQVKNFGRSGRTKYTHLMDQDTTQMDSPWMADTAQNLKFHTTKGGGTKQVFLRPSVKKRK